MDAYELAKERYMAGKTVKQSISGLDIGLGSFTRKIFLDEEVTVRSKGITPIEENVLKEIISLRKKGLSIRKISEIVGVERHRISVWLKMSEKETKDLARHEYNEDAFDEIDTPEKAYWLGMIYSDGCTIPTKNVVHLTLKNSDKDHLERFAKFLGPTVKVVRHSEIAHRVIISNKKIHDALVLKGCGHRKSATLQFPEKGLIPDELMRHFIRGCFDGDGGLHIETNSRNKKTKSLLFHLTATHDFIKDLKAYMNITNKPNRSSLSPFIVTLRVKGNKKPLAILDWLYEDTDLFLPRKKAIYEEFKKIKNVDAVHRGNSVEDKSGMKRGSHEGPTRTEVLSETVGD